ncbi:hypothetical protein RHMOL_Rhmol01G0097900 [Rhododendron molle]|uniref:Uncharacterized protein n=1 Tax=Rhododendron molle TaxID=49168 RepID=A0ACC0Q1M6_RHOML|nr:hypothetical protein RHMOL_Rhmol01G0097900 [Rhododendron molle]
MDVSQAEGCSSSYIPILSQWIYHVFVSFRGADTRKNFTSHLFAALEDNGFRTFRDDKELERGEYISDGLVKAIEGSRMSLIVFSKDYAGSRWCLDELVRIMNCKGTLKQIVVPIFYDVVPSDVRKQTGVLQRAFAEHEKRFREGSDGKVEKWRAALTEAANLSGRHLLNEANGDEAELIKMIIEDVREKGTEAVKGLILNATNVQVNTKPFEKMDRLCCLKELNLKDCHLSYLPDEIGNLISLRTLDLAQNNLNTLPDGICDLTCLKRLRLDDNNVSHLPSGIGMLTSLESLNLERNSLCTLPETIGKLSCLKELFVGNNKLSHLPSEIGDLDSLKILKLQHNNGFHAFPESICKLIRLRGLSLYDCNLSHLPSGIGGLVSLGSLNLGKNNFCTIPDSISNHPRLETIHLNNCAKLRSLPKLPTHTSVVAERCPSLESLPLEMDQLGWKVDYSKSSKLAENNFLTSLLKQLPKSKGVSELQHVVSIVVPAGDEEVPIWFPYHGRGPNVSFVVPPSPSVEQKLLGWILRLLLWAPRQAPYQQSHELCIEEVICNKIKKEGLLDVLFTLRVGPTDVDHVWLQYMPQGYEGLQLEGGDEVEIPIYANDALVKNWAIDLIYEADEIHKGTDTLYQVVSI